MHCVLCTLNFKCFSFVSIGLFIWNCCLTYTQCVHFCTRYIASILAHWNHHNGPNVKRICWWVHSMRFIQEIQEWWIHGELKSTLHRVAITTTEGIRCTQVYSNINKSCSFLLTRTLKATWDTHFASLKLCEINIWTKWDNKWTRSLLQRMLTRSTDFVHISGFLFYA